MSKTNSSEFLEELLTTPSPTGYEKEGVKVWKKYVEGFAQNVVTDAYGSCAGQISIGGDVATVML